MNVKIFENDDRLVIEVSGANLKSKINENIILTGILQTLLNGQEITEIPGLVPIPEEKEINSEGMNQITKIPFSYNGKELKDLTKDERINAGFALLKYRKQYNLSEEEQNFLKQFAYSELCFVKEDEMDVSVMSEHLALAGEIPENDIKAQYRNLIDDTINSIWS